MSSSPVSGSYLVFISNCLSGRKFLDSQQYFPRLLLLAWYTIGASFQYGHRQYAVWYQYAAAVRPETLLDGLAALTNTLYTQVDDPQTNSQSTILTGNLSESHLPSSTDNSSTAERESYHDCYDQC